MTEIPDWAGKRACELMNAEWAKPVYSWPRNASNGDLRAVAKLVMQHEQPPADPDEEAVKRVFGKSGAMADTDAYFAMYPEALARAVAQFKKERENG